MIERIQNYHNHIYSRSVDKLEMERKRSLTPEAISFEREKQNQRQDSGSPSQHGEEHLDLPKEQGDKKEKILDIQV